MPAESKPTPIFVAAPADLYDDMRVNKNALLSDFVHLISPSVKAYLKNVGALDSDTIQQIGSGEDTFSGLPIYTSGYRAPDIQDGEDKAWALFYVPQNTVEALVLSKKIAVVYCNTSKEIAQTLDLMNEGLDPTREFSYLLQARRDLNTEKPLPFRSFHRPARPLFTHQELMNICKR